MNLYIPMKGSPKSISKMVISTFLSPCLLAPYRAVTNKVAEVSGKRRDNPTAVVPGLRGCGKTQPSRHSEEPAGGPEHREGRTCICLNTRNADPSPQKAVLRMTVLDGFFRSLLSPAPGVAAFDDGSSARRQLLSQVVKGYGGRVSESAFMGWQSFLALHLTDLKIGAIARIVAGCHRILHNQII